MRQFCTGDGLRIIAAAAVANWNHVAVGSSVLDRIRLSLAPILILDGRRDAAIDRRGCVRRAAAPR